jgi:hypothetical protein
MFTITQGERRCIDSCHTCFRLKTRGHFDRSGMLEQIASAPPSDWLCVAAIREEFKRTLTGRRDEGDKNEERFATEDIRRACFRFIYRLGRYCDCRR